LESGATSTKLGRFVAGAEPEARRKKDEAARHKPAASAFQMLD